MTHNPLQQHFRQPKIYISLPSKGIYNKIGSIQGDCTNLPIYGMTGKDEIIMKTPDALITGDATVKLFESCCPSIKDGWEVSSLDTDMILTAIRIATQGNTMSVMHNCPSCNALNEYDVDLSNVVDHYSSCQYDNKITLKELSIKLQPLSYKQTSDFSNRNFKVQQQLIQADTIDDQDEKKKLISKLFEELGNIQHDIFVSSIESVDIGTSVVTEKQFISEWLNNCDKSVFDEIKNKFNKNKETWKTPKLQVKCAECNHETKITIELDQSNFFVKA